MNEYFKYKIRDIDFKANSDNYVGINIVIEIENDIKGNFLNHTLSDQAQELEVFDKLLKGILISLQKILYNPPCSTRE